MPKAEGGGPLFGSHIWSLSTDPPPLSLRDISPRKGGRGESGVFRSPPQCGHGESVSLLLLGPNRLIPIDPTVRAPSIEPHVAGRTLVSAFRVDLSAAAARSREPGQATGAAIIVLMRLYELRVQGQAHPRAPLPLVWNRQSNACSHPALDRARTNPCPTRCSRRPGSGEWRCTFPRSESTPRRRLGP